MHRLLVVVLILCAAAVAPHGHAAPDNHSPVEITLSEIVPISPQLSGSVTLAGTVRNVTNQPITRVQVHMWRSRTMVSTQEDVRAAVDSEPGDPVGERLLDVDRGQVQSIPSAENPTLAPGEEAPFRVTAAVSGPNSLGFTSPGVALVGIHVRGVPQGQSNHTIGRARTLLAIHQGSAPVRSEIVLLSSAPAQLGATLFADDHLEQELQGRLATLLDRALLPGRTVIIDPELIEALTALSADHSIRGNPAPQRASRQAAQWLQRLAPLLTSQRAYQGLYATPNVALAAKRADPHLHNDLHTAARDLPTSNLPLAVVSTGGREVTEYCAPSSPELLVTTAGEAPGVHRGQPWVAAVSDTLPAPGPGRPSRAQRSASQAAQAAVDVAAGRTPVHLITEPSDITALSGLDGYTVVPVSHVPDRAIAWTTRDIPTANAEWDSAITTGRDAFALWRTLTGGSTAAGDEHKIMARAWSTRFATPDAATAWTRAAIAPVVDHVSGRALTLQSAGNFVVGSGDTQIPFTVSNSLPSPVKVRLVFTSSSPQRIDIEPSDDVIVRAGETSTIIVRPKVAGKATVTMTAQLETDTGQPVGAPQEFTVQASSVGDVGWIVILASGAVFLGATAWRIRAGQRKGSDQHGDERKGMTDDESVL